MLEMIGFIETKKIKSANKWPTDGILYDNESNN